MRLTLRDAVGAELERRHYTAARRSSCSTPSTVANAGHHRVAGYVLVANVDAGVLGDVLYPDAGASWQPVIRPVPLHLVHRPTPLRPVRTVHRPRLGARPRRTRCCRRRSAKAGDDGPPHTPVKHSAPGVTPEALYRTSQPRGPGHGRAYLLVTSHA